MAAPYPQLVLFGDSLLQHAVDIQQGFSFQAALQSHCNRRLDVVNRGLSGYNTANALRFLEEIFPARVEGTPEMKYLIVLFGANDAVLPLSTTSQHVPIDEYTDNLQAIISHRRIVAHKPKVLLVTPPPIDEMKLARLDMEAGHESVTRNFATTAAYAERVREVAKRRATKKDKDGDVHVVLIDLWKALMNEAISMASQEQKKKSKTGGDGSSVGSRENSEEEAAAAGLEKLLPDGLHMGGGGYAILFDLILPHVGSEWKAVEKVDDGFVLPSWKEL